MKLLDFIKILTPKEKILFPIGLILEKSLLRYSLYQRLKRKKRFIFDANQIDFEYKEDISHIKLLNQNGEITLRKNSSDIEVFKQIYIGGEYDPVIELLLINKITIDTIVDLGSNIGLSCRKFLDNFNPSKIICLEPDAQNHEILRHNLKNYSSTTTILQKAIWYRNERIFIDFSFRDGKEWSRGVSTQNSGIEVEGISLDEIIKENKLVQIDLLKIDIEGTESKILNPLYDLSFLSLVKVIAIEIHDEFKCRNMIYEVLGKNNFILFNTGELTIGIKTNKI
jgi:FkbM family methyltransferase